jgi:hypothetical protein
MNLMRANCIQQLLFLLNLLQMAAKCRVKPTSDVFVSNDLIETKEAA